MCFPEGHMPALPTAEEFVTPAIECDITHTLRACQLGGDGARASCASRAIAYARTNAEMAAIRIRGSVRRALWVLVCIITWRACATARMA